MDVYTEEDFDENNPDNIVDSDDSQEEENSGKSELDESQDEEFEEEEENEDEDMGQNPVDEVMARGSTQTRCTILNEEVRLLKLENELLISRENSLKQRLELYDDDNATLNSRLMESERKVASLNKEIELIKCKSDARQETLENSYRDLCSKIATSEEANQKMRFNLNEQKSKLSVLEEIIESKNVVIAELERRLEHLTPTSQANVRVNGIVQPYDNVKQLTYRLHATEQQLDQVVAELSRVVSCNSDFKNSLNKHTNKYFDYNAMLKEYNSKCVKLKEMEERLHGDENRTRVVLLEEEIRLLNLKLTSRMNTLKENDKELKEFYLKQMDDLKNMVSEHKSELLSKQDEVNKIKAENQSLMFQLDLKNKTIVDKTDQLEQVKSQCQSLNMENEQLKTRFRELSEQLRSLKMELQVVMDREQTHMTEFNNYMNDTDLKLKKMELVLMHSHQMPNKIKEPQVELDTSDEMQVDTNISEAFKEEVMNEFVELKQLISSFDKSKRDQQQINNLILTLRHQNDTVISTIKEENKNTLNSFSERNSSNLSELKQEYNKVISSFEDKISVISENITKWEEKLVEGVKEQFELLKAELRVGVLDSATEDGESLHEQQGQANQQPELEHKYNKLKESFKSTTASLLRKEKILLDSLKKTVLECHTYKEKLEKLSGSTQEPKKCNCITFVKYRESQLKSARNCWCKLKTNNLLRLSITKRARICESATLDSIKISTNKKRTLRSSTKQ